MTVEKGEGMSDEEIRRLVMERNALKEALENMVGMFDTPVVRMKFNSEFHILACESAREALKISTSTRQGCVSYYV